jgi:hypothetical protein
LYFLLNVLPVTNAYTPITQFVLRLAVRKATGDPILDKDKNFQIKEDALNKQPRTKKGIEEAVRTNHMRNKQHKKY